MSPTKIRTYAEVGDIEAVHGLIEKHRKLVDELKNNLKKIYGSIYKVTLKLEDGSPAETNGQENASPGIQF